MEARFVGVDLGGTNVVSGLITPEGEILARDKRPTRVSKGREAILESITDCIEAAVKEGGISTKDLTGIGIGSPGPLNPYTGVVVSPSNLPPMTNMPLRDLIQDHFGVPAVLDNDANVVAYGEKWKGAGKDVNDFLCVTLGTGVGGGAVCGGQLLRGFNGNAVEIGHTTIDCNGPRCGCGNRGCLELYASSTGMVRLTRQRIREQHPDTVLTDHDGLESKHIYEAARAGDALAKEMFEVVGYYLGMGLVSAINLLNVEVVALAGGLAGAGELIFEPTRRTIAEYGLKGVKEYVRVTCVELGEDAALLGAAKVAMDASPGRRPS